MMEILKLILVIYQQPQAFCYNIIIILHISYNYSCHGLDFMERAHTVHTSMWMCYDDLIKIQLVARLAGVLATTVKGFWR